MAGLILLHLSATLAEIDPLTVKAGVLTAKEFRSLPPAERDGVESSTAEMLQRYGPDVFVAYRNQHRAALQLAWGFDLDPDGVQPGQSAEFRAGGGSRRP